MKNLTKKQSRQRVEAAIKEFRKAFRRFGIVGEGGYLCALALTRHAGAMRDFERGIKIMNAPRD